jgi:choline dehydrogenase
VAPDIGAAGDLHALVREQAYSVPHTVGTCAMGTVVDAAGRVHGTEGLRVIDASIIPTPPSGFPHIVAITLAERLAEKIADDSAP